MPAFPPLRSPFPRRMFAFMHEVPPPPPPLPEAVPPPLRPPRYAGCQWLWRVTPELAGFLWTVDMVVLFAMLIGALIFGRIPGGAPLFAGLCVLWVVLAAEPAWGPRAVLWRAAWLSARPPDLGAAAPAPPPPLGLATVAKLITSVVFFGTLLGFLLVLRIETQDRPDLEAPASSIEIPP